MNIKLLILMIVGFAGIASFGVLQNNSVIVNNESFGVLNSVESFTSGFNCACSDPNNSEGGFDMGNCNVQYLVEPSDGPDGIHGTADDVLGIADPNSLGLVGNKLCTWETGGEDYGDLLNNDEGGCTPKDWIKLSKRGASNWPPGYHKDLLFNDIFQTTLYQYVIKGIDSDDDDDDDDDDRRGHDDDDDDDKGKKDKDDKGKKYKDDKDDRDKDAKGKKYKDDKDDKDKDDNGKKHKDNKGKTHIDGKGYKHKFYDIYELTLIQALKNKGDWEPHSAKFAKQAVASLLNAAHFDINYYYSGIEIIQMTQDTVVNNDYKDMTKEFKKYNKIGNDLVCPKR